MAPSSTKGFFTDSTLCIGCKACEVACKQWNQLPADEIAFTGFSYDNTVALGASTWRHVAFIEKDGAWLFNSDVCKHCAQAGCLEGCPTGAIVRTEFGSVYVQPDVCNGCGYCIVSCPFGVIDRRAGDGRAFKCTLCYDRLRDGLQPACAQTCPTNSIQFGDVVELRERAQRRVEQLHAQGRTEAYLYGVDQPGTGGLNAFFLLMDEPESYNLPPKPRAPSHTAKEGWMAMAFGALGLAAAALASVAASGKNKKDS